MESVYQDAAEVSEVELTPQDQLRLQWQQQPGVIALLRQKNVIDQNAELLPYAAVAGLPGWISPGMFALQGLVLIAFIAAGLNWLMTRHSGKLEEEIIACAGQLKDRDQASGRNYFGHAGGDQKNFQFAQLEL